MLDMGFIPDIENICTKLPAQRQTLLFSATMPPPIKKLADRFLTNPKSIEVARPASNNLSIVQHKVLVASKNKRDVLRHLLRTDDVRTAIIFANRKTTVRDLNKALRAAGFSSGEIHGDMDQSSRIAELQRFKDGDINILCASDVAARGLDVKGVSHVFNFDTPWHPDDYVHRIGRTGRAGATGRAFTLVSPEDAEAIENVEKLTGGPIPVFTLDGAVEAGGDVVPAKRPARSRAARQPESDAEPTGEGQRTQGKRVPGKRAVDKRPVAVAPVDAAPEDSVAPAKPRRARGKPPGAVATPEVAQEIAPAERPARSETPAPAKAPVRDEAPAPAGTPARAEAPARHERRPNADSRLPRRDDQPRGRWRDNDPPTKPGEWNGPIPEFLSASAVK
jgi:superfamily II DNA/RNA helicase